MDINSDNLRTFFPALLTSGDDEDYERFCQLLRPRKLAAGEALVRRGGRSGALSLVVHGRLAVALNGPAGAMPLGETGSGSWVGELSLIRPANARLVCAVAALDRSSFNMVAKSPLRMSASFVPSATLSPSRTET